MLHLSNYFENSKVRIMVGQLFTIKRSGIEKGRIRKIALTLIPPLVFLRPRNELSDTQAKR